MMEHVMLKIGSRAAERLRTGSGPEGSSPKLFVPGAAGLPGRSRRPSSPVRLHFNGGVTICFRDSRRTVGIRKVVGIKRLFGAAAEDGVR